MQTWRLLYGPPAPYTRERFQATYEWMRGYPGLVTAEATYEAVVDMLRARGAAGASVLLGVDGTAHGARKRATFFGADDV